MLHPLRIWIAKPLRNIGTRLFGNTSVDTVRSGSWFGNDTTWRMVADLARIFVYADENGRLHDRPVCTCLNVVDGIVAGEGNRPLDPVAKPCGMIVAGRGPLAVDLV